jgi:hypothetical protein
VEECRTLLVSSDPLIPNLPLPLHCSQEVHRSHTVTLNPHEERRFDVFRISQDGKDFEFTGAAYTPSMPMAPFKLKLTAVGKNVRTEEASFEIVLAGVPKLRPC